MRCAVRSGTESRTESRAPLNAGSRAPPSHRRIETKRDDHESRVGSCRLAQELPRAIAAAVVHEHDLVRAPGKRVENGPDPPQELGHDSLFVVERNGDRHARMVRHGLAGLPYMHARYARERATSSLAVPERPTLLTKFSKKGRANRTRSALGTSAVGAERPPPRIAVIHRSARPGERRGRDVALRNHASAPFRCAGDWASLGHQPRAAHETPRGPHAQSGLRSPRSSP